MHIAFHCVRLDSVVWPAGCPMRESRSRHPRRDKTYAQFSHRRRNAPPSVVSRMVVLMVVHRNRDRNRARNRTHRSRNDWWWCKCWCAHVIAITDKWTTSWSPGACVCVCLCICKSAHACVRAITGADFDLIQLSVHAAALSRRADKIYGLRHESFFCSYD